MPLRISLFSFWAKAALARWHLPRASIMAALSARALLLHKLHSHPRMSVVSELFGLEVGAFTGVRWTVYISSWLQAWQQGSHSLNLL